jgi:hypothetical protein
MQDGKVCDLKKKTPTTALTPSKPVPSKVAVVATPSKSGPSSSIPSALKTLSTPKATAAYAQVVKSGAKPAPSNQGPSTPTPASKKTVVPFLSPLTPSKKAGAPFSLKNIHDFEPVKSSTTVTYEPDPRGNHRKTFDGILKVVEEAESWLLVASDARVVNAYAYKVLMTRMKELREEVPPAMVTLMESGYERTAKDIRNVLGELRLFLEDHGENTKIMDRSTAASMWRWYRKMRDLL